MSVRILSGSREKRLEELIHELDTEKARLLEALLEARAALRHASVNIAYTKSKAAADDIDRVLQALAATDRLKENP